jgi:uncharacterized protein YegP (UPF0339 family)
MEAYGGEAATTIFARLVLHAELASVCHAPGRSHVAGAFYFAAETVDLRSIALNGEGNVSAPAWATGQKRQAQFVLFKDVRGEYRWRFEATNGEPVAQSEGYKARAGAVHGIEVLQREAAGARMIEIQS